jgi:VWFA-related protein
MPFNRSLNQCVAMLGLLLPLAAQDAPVFRADTRLATVSFHVGQKGFYVEKLRAADFELREDGKSRGITFFEGGDSQNHTVPVELIVLFDRSGSMVNAGMLQPVAFQDRVIRGLPNVSLSIYAFTSHLQRYSGPTRDADAISAAFDAIRNGSEGGSSISVELPANRKEEKGGTWIFESVMAAARDAAKGPASVSRMMLVFSDGLSSTTSVAADAAPVCEELGIPVYVVAVGHAKVLDSLARSHASTSSKHPSVSSGSVGAQTKEAKIENYLHLAPLTGGMAFDLPAITVDVMQKLLDGLVGEVRTEYVAGYVPEASEGSPRPHKVEIRLVNKSLGSLVGGTRTVVH